MGDLRSFHVYHFIHGSTALAHFCTGSKKTRVQPLFCVSMWGLLWNGRVSPVFTFFGQQMFLPSEWFWIFVCIIATMARSGGYLQCGFTAQVWWASSLCANGCGILLNTFLICS